MCQCLLKQLPDEVDIALVLNPKLSTVDLLSTICDELSVPYDRYRKTLKHLIDPLNHYLLTAHAKGRRTVLMIDEAQNLGFDVLEQIRLLTNLETSKTKLLQIILIGQPELKKRLESRQLRQLNQRITARYHLMPLNETETRQYIHHRVAISHGQPDIFKSAAIHRIFQLSSGIPRLINLICDRSLLGAYANNTRQVTKSIVNQAAHEIDSRLISVQRKTRLTTLISVLIFSIVFAAFFHSREWNRLNFLKNLPVSVTSKQQDKMVISGPVNHQNPARQKAEFRTYIQHSDLTLQRAFKSLLKHWNLAQTKSLDCTQLALNCLADTTSWAELVSLHRPAIMEFPLEKLNKHYLLLISVKNGQPVFMNDDTEISFSLEEVISIWQGKFLMLWKSPYEKVNIIYPHQHSPAVIWLRKQFDLSTGGEHADYFDGDLLLKVQGFQASHQLLADGIAGPRTIIHLQNQNTPHTTRSQRVH